MTLLPVHIIGGGLGLVSGFVALYIASASFFLGPRGRVPEAIRIPALLPIPVLVPIVAMLYWLWRVRRRRSLRGAIGVSAAEAV